MASSSLCEQGQVLEDLPAVLHGLEAEGALPSGSGQGEKLKLYAVKKCRLERKNKITSRVRTPPAPPGGGGSLGHKKFNKLLFCIFFIPSHIQFIIVR